MTTETVVLDEVKEAPTLAIPQLPDKTPYDTDVSPNPANREEFLRSLIQHVRDLTEIVRTQCECCAESCTSESTESSKPQDSPANEVKRTPPKTAKETPAKKGRGAK